MGTDKALVEVDGIAMALRVAAALRGGGAGPVICVGGDVEALARLGLDAVRDRYPSQGPLGGVCTAFVAARERGLHTVAIAACDQYRLDAATVAALLDAIAGVDPASTALAVCGAGQSWAPLPMVARVGAVALIADAAFAAGERSLRALLDRTGTVVVRGLDPQALVDADEPDDLPGR